MAIKNPAPYKSIARAYTRHSRVSSKAYIRTVPPQAIVKFVMGDAAKFNKNGYNYLVEIKSKQDAQIRDVSVEAARNLLHREIGLDIGADYYMSVGVYPHHILREHKQAAIAQADRISSGMSLSFGKSVGRAAQVHKGKPLFTIAFNTAEDVRKFRPIYDKVKQKFACTTALVVTPIKK